MPIGALERLFDPLHVVERQGREKKTEVRYFTAHTDGDPPIFERWVCGWLFGECLAETMSETIRRPER